MDNYISKRILMPVNRYVTRICWNSAGWVAPTGEAGSAERGSYAATYGFGHEEWLFDLSRQIDGWCYGRIEPIWKSQDKMFRDGDKVFDLQLYTIDPDKRRWLVGEIRGVELLHQTERTLAEERYRLNGWVKEMEDQLRALGLRPPRTLKKGRLPSFILRFQPDNAHVHDSLISLPASHPGARVSRYVRLRHRAAQVHAHVDHAPTRKGVAQRPTNSYLRSSIPGGPVEQAHNLLQQELFGVLRNIYGKDCVQMECDFVDLMVQVGNGDETSTTHLLEVKPWSIAREAIRASLGQLLEYAYYRPREGCVQLHVVAPAPLKAADRAYLGTLRTQFGIDLHYHSFVRGQSSFSLDVG